MQQVIGGGPGEPAGKIKNRFLPDKEVIGPPECPLLYRWTLFPWSEHKHENKGVRFKLLLHHFPANADDRDPHDHPRPFVTFVVKGYYDDKTFDPATNVFTIERVRAGSLHYRSAKHTHRTKVGPKGCWTIVVMGPIARTWGFWREGRWMYWRDHERAFGYGMRCPTDEES